LKIDQSFVRDLVTDSDDASIVRAVIGMGKSLNMQVVAEGVETSEQLTFLKQQICPQGQGYLFSRPLEADALCSLVERAVLRTDAHQSGWLQA
jgi:EAL domain-containing protein (putative c-di-GMP-specific phosphodiesterase class I)